jgi:alkylation response protein AidB-like acyl-CoA dehydrogenase
MNLARSSEHDQFATALHELLAAADGPAAARSWAAGDRKPGLEIWRSLAEAGVTALMVPANHGGLGADPVDLVIACEEIGHHAVPGPAAESLAGVPVLLAGLDDAALAGTPAAGAPERLAAGELIATLAAPPVLPYAADAEAAGLVLLAGPDRLSAAAPGTSWRSVDAARTLTAVTPAGPLAAGPQAAAAIERAIEFGTLACAAQLLGLGRALLDLTAAHARQRVQFGQPVGGFQAVKHQLADVAIGLEFARPLLSGAAVALAARAAHAPRDVSAAKVACTAAATRAARTALQVHGAIGYTAEHDAGLYLTKVRALGPAWGSQAWHRGRVLAAITGPMVSGTGGSGSVVSGQGVSGSGG